MRYDQSQISHTVEIPEFYDGASVIVLKDGTVLNAFEDPDNPGHALPPYERRYQAVQDWLEQNRDHELLEPGVFG